MWSLGWLVIGVIGVLGAVPKRDGTWRDFLAPVGGTYTKVAACLVFCAWLAHAEMRTYACPCASLHVLACS